VRKNPVTVSRLIYRNSAIHPNPSQFFFSLLTNPITKPEHYKYNQQHARTDAQFWNPKLAKKKKNQPARTQISLPDTNTKLKSDVNRTQLYHDHTEPTKITTRREPQPRSSQQQTIREPATKHITETVTQPYKRNSKPASPNQGGGNFFILYRYVFCRSRVVGLGFENLEFEKGKRVRKQ